MVERGWGAGRARPPVPAGGRGPRAGLRHPRAAAAGPRRLRALRGAAPGPLRAGTLRRQPAPSGAPARQRRPLSRRHRGPGGTRREAEAGAGGRTVISVCSLPCRRRGNAEKASLVVWCGPGHSCEWPDGATAVLLPAWPIPIPLPAPRPSPLSPANASRWRLHAPSLPWHPKRETGLWAPPIPAGQWPWRLLSPPERSWPFLLTVSSRCSSSFSSSSSAKLAGPPHVPRRPQLLMWMSQGMKRSTCCSPDLPGDWGIHLSRRSCARLDACAATRVLDQAR